MGLFGSGNKDRARELQSLADENPRAAAGHVDEAVGLLQDSAGTVRQNASYLLVQVAREYPDQVVGAVDPLVGLLSDGDETVRENATHALAMVAREYPGEVVRGADRLIDALSDYHAVARANAALAVGHVGREYPERIQPAAERLVELLDDRMDLARSNAALALFKIADDDPGELLWAVDSLIAALDDTNKKARGNVAVTLAAVAAAYPDRIDDAVRRRTLAVVSAATERTPVAAANALGFALTMARDFLDEESTPTNGADETDEANLETVLLTAANQYPERVLTESTDRIDDPDPDVRRSGAAGWSLLADGRPDLVLGELTTLLDALGDPTVEVRRFLTLALARIADDRPGDLQRTVEPLVERVDDPDDVVRLNATRALVEVAEPFGDSLAGEVGTLADRLDDDDPRVRTNAVAALNAITKTDAGAVAAATDALVACLDAEPDQLRTNAVAALVRLAEADPATLLDHVPVLVATLDDDVENARGNAAGALSIVARERPGAVVDAGAVEPLVALLGTAAAGVRANAVEAVETLSAGRPAALADAVGPLVDCLDDREGRVARPAATALERIAGERPAAVAGSVELLADHLSASREPVRRTVAATLAEVGWEMPGRLRAVAGPLAERLDDPSRGVRANAASALLALHEVSPAAVPASEDRLQSVADTARATTPTATASPPDEIPGGPSLTVDYDAIEQLDHVGGGGSADVYRAVADGTRAELAIKEPRTQGTMHADAVERFLEEAETWSKLDDSPFVVDVVDWGQAPYPWIAMEYMDGGHLGQRAGEVSLPEGLWIARSLARGLRHAHGRGVAHLDLKPENVLFRNVDDAWDVPKVADWGLAERLLDHSGSVEGLSPTYAAPEQFDAERFGQPDQSTDVYALGAVLYELFTGRPPFDDSETSVRHDVLESTPPAPTEVEPSLPAALDDLLLTCLETEPADRYEDALLLRDALDDLYERLSD